MIHHSAVEAIESAINMAIGYKQYDPKNIDFYEELVVSQDGLLVRLTVLVWIDNTIFQGSAYYQEA
jgi:hypothetical protein